MTDSEGFALELNAKHVGLISLAIGLVLGGFGGFAAGTVTVSNQLQQVSEQTVQNQDSNSANPDSNNEDSSTDLVSLEGIDLEGEPSIGESDAPIKVVEYNEFGCPFCAEWNGFDASPRTPIDQMDIAGNLQSQYIDSGEVELISKDFPVPGLHPNGPEAHKAANCVYEHEESSYFDFHDQLFERRDSWMQSGEGKMEATFRQISDDLSLDTEKVMSCYKNSDNKEANEDKNNALQNLGSFGTPTFFVGNQEKGFVKITGAQPLSRFEEAMDTVRNS